MVFRASMNVKTGRSSRAPCKSKVVNLKAFQLSSAPRLRRNGQEKEILVNGYALNS